MIMSADEIRKLGYRIVDMIAADLADPGRRPPFPPPPDLGQLEANLGGPPPTEAMDPQKILDLIAEWFVPASGNHNHPALMANVLTGAVPSAGLVEALVSALKIRPTTWRNQPASCFVEATVARWLGAMVGFAPDAAGYARMISSHLALARQLAESVRQAEDLEIMSEPVLSICCFRYAPPGTDREDRYLDELNHAIMERLIADGHAYISATELKGRYALRACIASYQVTPESVEQMLAIVRSAGQELDATMRRRPLDPRSPPTTAPLPGRRP